MIPIVYMLYAFMDVQYAIFQSDCSEFDKL